MADVLDYASQQGDDIGIYIAFILAFLIFLIPVGGGVLDIGLLSLLAI